MNQSNLQTSEQETGYRIRAEIRTAQQDIRRLIDYYSGAKTPGEYYRPRTEADDNRLFGTLKQLRERIKTLQKQLILLTGKSI